MGAMGAVGAVSVGVNIYHRPDAPRIASRPSTVHRRHPLYALYVSRHSPPPLSFRGFGWSSVWASEAVRVRLWLRHSRSKPVQPQLVVARMATATSTMLEATLAVLGLPTWIVSRSMAMHTPTNDGARLRDTPASLVHKVGSLGQVDLVLD